MIFFLNKVVLYKKMSFSLYDTLKKQNETRETLPSCTHANKIFEKGLYLCMNCGVEVPFDKEMTSKFTNDTTRCYIRKVKDKSIYEDVKHLHISDHIKDIANGIYTEVCGSKVHRGAYRRAIVFASIFHAYKLDHNPQTCDKLIALFDIRRRDALKGLKFINEHAPGNSPLRTTYITPENLLIDYMKQFNITLEQRAAILDLYNKVKGKSSLLNRSRPQSVAAGILFYYNSQQEHSINVKDFTKKVGLSELTIQKISGEIQRLVSDKSVL